MSNIILISIDVSESSKDLDNELYVWTEKDHQNLFGLKCKLNETKNEADESESQMDNNGWNVSDSSAFDQFMSSGDDLDYPVIGPQDVNPNWLSSNIPDTVRVLLVFGKEDQQLEVLASVARKINWHVSIAKNLDTAVQMFQNQFHDLVIIDHRGLHGQETCRALRSTNCHPSSVIIALVKKSFFKIADEKEGISAVRLLDVGFTRALMECSHNKILVNELLEIYTSAIRPKTQLAAAHALYLAVDRCRDMVHVTNEQHILQFANKVSEKLLGYKMEELVGTCLAEIITCEHFVLMDQQLQRGREFEGNMNCIRKTKDTITINCRIIPFCAYGRKPTHYIYVHDTTYLLENLGLGPTHMGFHQNPREEKSLRRGSFDVKSLGSDTQRRGSLAKLNLEAPITKVMILLNNAMSEATNPEVAMQIDKAIETLKSTELYAPVMKEDTKIVHDPVTSDLIGALISAPQYKDCRKSSHDSTGRISTVKLFSHGNIKTQAKTLRAPHEIDELLDMCMDWDFDIFKLEVLSGMRPLVFLGLTIMNQYQVAAELGCDERTLQNWLTVIEANYRSENSYHNSSHAADVLQAISKYMKSERLKPILNPLDEAAALLAAAAHDLDHPGRSSQFLCNSNNKLAILYNDLTVLESHHASLTFKLTLSDENVNIFKNLEREDYKMLRQNIIDMILATEMTKHFEHLAKFVNVCSTRGDTQSECYSDVDMSVLLLPENITLVKRMMIKCADVSNPTRPLRSCVEWTRRIAEEYFNQTDEEKVNKLPVVMPMFDRQTCSIPKSQIGFIDYIITDLIEAWSAFIDMPEMVGHMRQNYERWKEYHEQGISSLRDVELLQQTPELGIYKLPGCQ
ncbi:high affinity cAMP-specific and IBMX-insensitive 3',5'-cyclic phosphodiesterase 8 isoform X1 [Belonocnema kinseyi]|uniref:high affinity cAMP-specific and IBMX-insensitive 3',5'-cyclic phosphodiesterase 8 isoform X1 n=1 Tax=Belonocnema kinseyi TaxID=2817044 RepID=UPI00143DEF03|nr:high affinity cAMP-specific and IBMX-insensitive 3',5'-cyclic phosphodiesterase 8 isoform X1 [Belonocnema kinseyi]